jgi:hypothetical protein
MTPLLTLRNKYSKFSTRISSWVVRYQEAKLKEKLQARRMGRIDAMCGLEYQDSLPPGSIFRRYKAEYKQGWEEGCEIVDQQVANGYKI